MLDREAEWKAIVKNVDEARAEKSRVKKEMEDRLTERERAELEIKRAKNRAKSRKHRAKYQADLNDRRAKVLRKAIGDDVTTAASEDGGGGDGV